MPKKNIPYHNEDYERIVKEASSFTVEQQINIINRYPKVREHLTGLVMLFLERNQLGICIDDWECDLENQILNEIKPRNRRKD